MPAKRIVVGTDGSAQATMAVEWAADEAARHGAPLHVVHVVDDVALGMPAVAAEARQVLERAEKLVRDRCPHVPVGTEQTEGNAAFVLRERARDAATVVVGHRGAGGFARLLAGSTALQVAGYAACPVVIVRGDAGAAGDVVVGLNLYGDNDAALDYAFQAASLRRARVRVVHACPLTQLLLEASRQDEALRIEQGQAQQIDRILSPWTKRHPHVRIVRQIVRSHPVVALEEASRQASLLVVGARGHSALQGVVLGSVSHGVVHHAHCPVAVLPLDTKA
ncbi:universal stress protein [Thermomonospora cellulosilytica]|uniref:Nucleotide-binding universal stress UspA family protein n=1 Tax=Thermomonospora cellulosilytica TaxID=1411118 RepID=A0A7W3R9Y1_9ACTN|nr:universal stress protein [Thermomonospora cellulosilytica]MBA9005251.1 nucleotide-binding universal stress UspA family protein [Thermomonospora cellulosilytica]